MIRTPTEVRESIAQAASAVPGVSAYPVPPSAPGRGDLWPQLSGADPRPVTGTYSWSVMLCLGQDLTEADRLLGELLLPVCTALEPAMVVREVILGRMSVGAAEILTAEFSGRTPIDF